MSFFRVSITVCAPKYLQFVKFRHKKQNNRFFCTIISFRNIGRDSM